MLCFQLFDLHRKICEIGHLNKIFLKRVALATSPSTLHLSDLQRIIINRFLFEYIRYLKIKYLFLQIPYNGNQRYFSTFHTMELASMLKCFNSWSNIYLFFFSTIDESAGASDFSRSFVVFFLGATKSAGFGAASFQPLTIFGLRAVRFDPTAVTDTRILLCVDTSRCVVSDKKRPISMNSWRHSWRHRNSGYSYMVWRPYRVVVFHCPYAPSVKSALPSLENHFFAILFYSLFINMYGTFNLCTILNRWKAPSALTVCNLFSSLGRKRCRVHHHRQFRDKDYILSKEIRQSAPLFCLQWHERIKIRFETGRVLLPHQLFIKRNISSRLVNRY